MIKLEEFVLTGELFVSELTEDELNQIEADRAEAEANRIKA